MFRTIYKIVTYLPLSKGFVASKINKVAKWGFLSAVWFWGPGPIVTIIGVKGLLATAAATQSGIIGYAAGKLMPISVK